MEQEDEQEAIEYLRTVTQELKKRAAKLNEVEESIAHVEYRLQEIASGKDLLRGDTKRLVQGQSFRSSLKTELEKLQKDRARLQTDVERALERKRIVEEELNE